MIRSYLSFIVSLLIVGFGQPAWEPLFGKWLCLIVSMVGYAIFWQSLLDVESIKKRFVIGFCWMALLQVIQVWWMISHPYLYIIFVMGLIGAIYGTQFGLLSMAITKENILKRSRCVALTSFWVIMEWSRLFILSGVSWNPAGLSLSVFDYPLQTASLWGIYGLSFWVILSNLFFLRAFLRREFRTFALAAMSFTLPFAVGYVEYRQRTEMRAVYERSHPEMFESLLVQTAFPAEESFNMTLPQLIQFVQKEWTQILRLAAPSQGKSLDLVVLPEFVVPFGAYTFVYPYEHAVETFAEIFGESSIAMLPAKQSPWVREIASNDKSTFWVNNAFWAQGLSNVMNTPVVAGMEDVEINGHKKDVYSGALYFAPFALAEDYPVRRYSKQVLVPMAEYIPTSFCKQLAAMYGISGSFTCGMEPVIFDHHLLPFGLSICYEETFGNLTRMNRIAGAKLLVNLTSDVWFPGSKLPKQHLDHARLRTVENGIPLIRACNTGITCALDSLGRVTHAFDNEHLEGSEWTAAGLLVSTPTYTYQTLYSKFGDLPLIIVCAIFIFCYSIIPVIQRYRK